MSPYRAGLAVLCVAALWTTACRRHFDLVGDGGNGDDDSSTPPTMVTIEIVGSGTATVSDPTNAIACSSTCTVEVAPGTTLQLAVTTSGETWFRGWTQTCTGRRACTVAVAGEAMTITAELAPLPNRVFISSVSYDGNFGGVAGADMKCNQLAVAAGLTGTYAAMLSDTTTGWLAHLGSARGFVRTDGEPLADRATELDDAIRYAVRLDESGNDVGVLTRWVCHYGNTGTNRCADWTSALSTDTASVVSSVQSLRLDSGGASATCDTSRRLMCAGIERQVTLAPIAEVGRFAFVSTTLWSPDTGIAAADAVCQADADASSTPGSYRALLATSTASALSRFDLAGTRWVRRDGVAMLPSTAQWATAALFDAAPVEGTSAIGYQLIITGTRSLGQVATGNNCGDWSSTSGSMDGLWTWDATTSMVTGVPCGARRIYCLQQ